MRQLLVYPRAARDIELAIRWYELQRDGLGREFETALEATPERVRRTPEVFPVTAAPFRRALLRRFPYQVFFRNDEDTVFVALVFHTSKNPAARKTALRES